MVASGFSQNTCRPDRSARAAIEACDAGGVATTTTSTPSSVEQVVDRVEHVARRTPWPAPTAASRSRSITARTATSGRSATASAEEGREPAGADDAEARSGGVEVIQPFTPLLISEAVNRFWNTTNSATAGAASTTAPARIAPNGLAARPAMLLM